MKLLLLKSLWQRRDKEEGYVLPMVMAIGLVMVLLGAVNMTGAQEENFNAISKNSRSDALAIAEIGIAQYREMLDRNRILTIYNRAQWTSNNVNGVDVAAQTCDAMTDTLNGWANNDYDGLATVPPFNPPTGTRGRDYWRAIQLNENVINRDLNNDDDTVDNAVDIGWYKIVDYEYDIDGILGGTDNDGIIDATDDNGVFSVVSDANTADDPLPDPPGPSVPVNSITDENDLNDDGVSDARGILTVKGRTPDGSEAQIEVEIPIRINDLNNFAPVLWIGNGSITTPGNLNIPNPDDNIVLANAATCDAPPPIAGNTNVINDPRSIPAIINDPSDPILGLPVANRNGANNGIGTINITGTSLILPRPQTVIAPATSTSPAVLTAADNKTSDDEEGRFLYDINSLTINNTDLITDGVSKVTLHVQNNIDIDGSAGNVVTIGNEDSSNIANFNGLTSNVSSQNLEIYGSTNTTQIDINPNNGIVNIEALIHAPNATLNITGGGQVNINGALWVNDITNTGGATLTIRRDNTDTTTSVEPSYKFYTTSSNRTPRPLSSSPINWKTEEVN